MVGDWTRAGRSVRDRGHREGSLRARWRRIEHLIALHLSQNFRKDQGHVAMADGVGLDWTGREDGGRVGAV